MQPVEATKVYQILTLTFEHEQMRARLCASQSVSRCKCESVYVYFVINYGMVCTLVIKKYDAFVQITVSPIHNSHQEIDCIFELDIEWYHVDSVGSIRLETSQLDSIRLFVELQSSRFDSPALSLSLSRSNSSIYKSCSHTHSVRAHLVGDFSLYRFGKCVLQVQYGEIRVRNVIDYEMVNFMACSTHTTLLNRSVDLIASLLSHSHNQQTHSTVQYGTALQCTINPHIIFRNAFVRKSTSHFHFTENCYFIGEENFHYAPDSKLLRLALQFPA